MMPNQISVLIYGHDLRTMESRRWALQSCGYRALSVRRLSEMTSVPIQPAIDLLVLTSTLTAKECESAISYARLRWPDVKTLALVRQPGTRHASVKEAALTQVTKVLDAPAQLLSTVGQLVGHAASSSFSHIY